MNLSKNSKITMTQAPLASGGSDLPGDPIDMQHSEGVLFIGLLGTAGSTDICTLAAFSSTAAGGSYVALSSITQSSTKGNSDKFFALDVHKPLNRFVKAQLTRDAVVEYGGTVAVQYGMRKAPHTHGTTTAVSTGTPVALGTGLST